jgi:hypothetical protein
MIPEFSEKGEGMGGTMIKNRQEGGAARVSWMVYILIALIFGGFLGSPVPDVWADRISEVVSAMSEPHNTRMIHNEKNDHAKNPGNQITDSGISLIVSEPTAQVQPDYICLSANRGGIANRKEKDVLIHLINAEAYGLSYKAKVAVGQVVMNRWTGPYYGDDLLAIMTAPYQFTPICDGSAYNKKIESDSIEAANAVLAGAGIDELTDDTYYFVNPDFTEDKTIEQSMVFVCEIEGLHFYKPPAK